MVAETVAAIELRTSIPTECSRTFSFVIYRFTRPPCFAINRYINRLSLCRRRVRRKFRLGNSISAAGRRPSVTGTSAIKAKVMPIDETRILLQTRNEGGTNMKRIGNCQCEFGMSKNHPRKTTGISSLSNLRPPEWAACRQYGRQLCHPLLAQKSCTECGFLSRIWTVNNLGIRANRLS